MTHYKKSLVNQSGEGHIDTGIKIIIGIVIGALILGGLYALFATVIIPQMDDEVDQMMDYGKDGVSVQRLLNDETGTYTLKYSYDGKHWQNVQMPNYGDGASVYSLIDGDDEVSEQAAIVKKGTSYYVIASADGIKWTEQFSFTATSITHFYYGSSSELPRTSGSFSGNRFVIRWLAGGSTYYTGSAVHATSWSKPIWSDLIPIV